MSVFIGSKNKRVELAERKDATNLNLFSNTDKSDKFWQPLTDGDGAIDNSTQYASNVNYELIATQSVVHSWGTKASNAGVKTTQPLYFESGIYTISFLAKNHGTTDVPSYGLSLYSDYTDSRNGTPLGATRTNLTNVWQQYSITFKIAKAGTYGNWRLAHLSDDRIPGGSLYFANLKLEHGSVATPWCPALEDYAWTSDITNLQGQIQANKTDVTNLQSMITGLSTKVDSLQQNSLKIVPITQADYDALTDDQKANGMYAIGDSN